MLNYTVHTTYDVTSATASIGHSDQLLIQIINRYVTELLGVIKPRTMLILSIYMSAPVTKEKFSVKKNYKIITSHRGMGLENKKKY